MELKIHQDEQAKTLKAWAEYELKQGDHAKGEALWQEARALFVKLGIDTEVKRMDAKTQELGIEPSQNKNT